MGKWYGRIGYDREGIVREAKFKTESEAKAYKMGALDMKDLCDVGIINEEFNPLEDHWATSSNVESIEE